MHQHCTGMFTQSSIPSDRAVPTVTGPPSALATAALGVLAACTCMDMVRSTACILADCAMPTGHGRPSALATAAPGILAGCTCIDVVRSTACILSHCCWQRFSQPGCTSGPWSGLSQGKWSVTLTECMHRTAAAWPSSNVHGCSACSCFHGTTKGCPPATVLKADAVTHLAQDVPVHLCTDGICFASSTVDQHATSGDPADTDHQCTARACPLDRCTCWSCIESTVTVLTVAFSSHSLPFRCAGTFPRPACQGLQEVD